MFLLTLFLLPAVIHPLPAIMPFYDVNQREREQTKTWQLSVEKLRRNDENEEIKAVNQYWSKPSYWYVLTPRKWQTPEEVFENHSGDCKDLAIAKYYSLRYLGVPASRMRFTVVLDEENDWHAVLVIDNKVLDNRTKSIKNLDEVDYEPAYSVNEDNLWTLTEAK